MNAPLTLHPESARLALDSFQDAGLDSSTWHSPAFIASNWLAYSLANLVTGPILSAYANHAESDHTVSNSAANRFAKTFEIKIANKISRPLSEEILKNSDALFSTPEQWPLLASLAQHCAIFQMLQESSDLASQLATAPYLPNSYFARLKSNLELDIAGQLASALDKSFSALIDQAWNAIFTAFATPQEVAVRASDSATQDMSAARAEKMRELRAVFDEPPSDNLLSTSYPKDYLVFSIFYLLKISAALRTPPNTPLQLYVDMVADEGMVTSSDRAASAIAQYLIETRETALDSIFRENSYLEEIQNNAKILIQDIWQSLPQTLQTLLNLASPSQEFHSKYGTADFIKDLLTSVAIAIPATGVGIHLLPKIIDSKSLAFSMLMETSTNVIINLVGRAALPLSDFMGEKSWSAMQALHFMLCSPQTLQDCELHAGEDSAQMAHSAGVPDTMDMLPKDMGSAWDLGLLQDDLATQSTRHESWSKMQDLPDFHSTQECPSPSLLAVALLVGVVQPSCLATAG